MTDVACDGCGKPASEHGTLGGQTAGHCGRARWEVHAQTALARRTPRLRTHHRGLVCTVCSAVLETSCCDDTHGHDEQEPSAWAHLAWPDHACFEPERSDQ